MSSSLRFDLNTTSCFGHSSLQQTGLGLFESAYFFWNISLILQCCIALIHVGHVVANILNSFFRLNRGVIKLLEKYYLVNAVLVYGFLLLVLVLLSVFPPLDDQHAYFFWTQIPFDPATGKLCWWVYISWAGIALAFIVILFFLVAHVSLGFSWSAGIKWKHNHKLVTTWAYRFCRHPMYLCSLLWGVVFFLSTGNWLLGVAWTLAAIYPSSRYREEENLMIQRYGQTYLRYMDEVGPFCPLGCRGSEANRERAANSERQPLMHGLNSDSAVAPPSPVVIPVFGSEGDRAGQHRAPHQGSEDRAPAASAWSSTPLLGGEVDIPPVVNALDEPSESSSSSLEGDLIIAAARRPPTTTSGDM